MVIPGAAHSAAITSLSLAVPDAKSASTARTSVLFPLLTVTLQNARVEVAAAWPAAAEAQSVARSFEDLQQVLSVGQSVVVTDNTGRRTRGAVAVVQLSSLVLDVTATKDNPRGLASFADDDVATIARRDSVVNGTLIGLGAGALAAWVFVRGNCGPAGYDRECAAIAGPVGLVAFVPAGAVAGALIDRAIGNKPVYVRSSRPAPSLLSVMPWFTRTARGSAFSLQF